MLFRDHARLAAIAAILLFLSTCSPPSSAPPPATLPATDSASLAPTPKLDPAPANTQLPPLPNFDDVLTFNPGGGLGFVVCEEAAPDSLLVLYDGIHPYARLCMNLRDVDARVPIRIRFSQPGKATPELWTTDLVFDSSGSGVYWQYRGAEQTFRINASYAETADRSLKLGPSVSWPLTVPAGSWRVTVVREGRGPIATDFQTSGGEGLSRIGILNSRSEQELMPSAYPWRTSYWPSFLSGDGDLKFVGTNYAPNVPVYVLLYRSEALEYRLAEKSVYVADSSGTIRGGFSGSYGEGTYILYGITDPNIPLGGIESRACDWGLPEAIGSACDTFGILPADCPGAPAPRMLLGEPGRVCARSSTVSLRIDPSWSADGKLPLTRDTRFIVVDGPSCADNATWWRVQMDNGDEGWLPEAGDAVDPYYVCPLP